MIELLLTLTLLQVPAVKNPTAVTFQCSVDHDQASGYELDILRVSDGALMAKLALGLPPKDAQGNCRAVINVMPYAFGVYQFRARTVAAGAFSYDSPVSDTWERAPGPPGKPVAGQ